MMNRWGRGLAGSYSILLVLTFFFWQIQGSIAQTVTFDISSTPVDVDKASVSAALGEVRLTKSSANGGLQVTQASTLSFAYIGVSIKNLPTGPFSINTATERLRIWEGLRSLSPAVSTTLV
jgi:hypothetical protein